MSCSGEVSWLPTRVGGGLGGGALGRIKGLEVAMLAGRLGLSIRELGHKYKFRKKFKISNKKSKIYRKNETGGKIC